MIEAFYGDFTFLKLLSILAFVTTVGLFFCGIPICRQIWKRRDTAEISGAPFLMGVLGGTCWCVYGFLKKDKTVLYVTGAQIVLYSTYTVFYWFMTKKKFWISVKVAALVSICASLVALVHFFGHKVFHPLGIVCLTLNIADFAAPLAGLKVVIRRGATSTLPLPLCIANFMVSSEWFLYGLLVRDFYLITPNGIGSLLAFSQLILFVVLPRKPMQRAPVLRLYDWLRSSCLCCCADRSLDIEAAAVVSVDNKKNSVDVLGIHRMSSRMSNKHRWSSRMITNVVGEVENVIHKVQGDQFGYKLNKEVEEEVSTDSGTLTPVEKPADDEHEVHLNVFEQSARSISSRISALRKGFGGSHAESATENGERRQTGTGFGEAEAEAEAEEGDGKGSEPAEAAAEEELVFPMTIRDANQLLQLSRRLSSRRGLGRRKKKTPGFGQSLQAVHFRAMRRPNRGAAAAQAADGLPIIEEFCAKQRPIKRANSAPNVHAKRGQ